MMNDDFVSQRTGLETAVLHVSEHVQAWRGSFNIDFIHYVIVFMKPFQLVLTNSYE